jgi:hypothetical protein
MGKSRLEKKLRKKYQRKFRKKHARLIEALTKSRTATGAGEARSWAMYGLGLSDERPKS